MKPKKYTLDHYSSDLHIRMLPLIPSDLLYGSYVARVSSKPKKESMIVYYFQEHSPFSLK